MMNKTFAYVCAPTNHATGFASSKLKEYSKTLFELGYVPICPCMMFSRFLSESVPEQREARRSMSLELLRRCRVLVVCSDELTEKMEAPRYGRYDAYGHQENLAADGKRR